MDRTSFAFGVSAGLALSVWIQHILSQYQSNKGIQDYKEASTPPCAKKGEALSLVQFNQIVTRLTREFQVRLVKAQQVKMGIVDAFCKGLASEGEDLQMLPSYVTSLPTGKEYGEIIALDLGGSNFRVLKFTLRGREPTKSTFKKYTIPDAIKKGTAEDLFGLVADCILDFIPETQNAEVPFRLGFTFSFPVKQTGIATGYLTRWTKGFSASGCVGEDVCKLLQEELRKRNINVIVNALVNDTTATMMACALRNEHCHAGLILGTGTNICYCEKIQNIPKWTDEIPESGLMMINTEWGAFDDSKNGILPITKFDTAVDEASPNKGKQLYEKMISGMYLGEISRRVCVDLIRNGELFGGNSSPAFETTWSFDTAYMSAVELDDTPMLTKIRDLLVQKMELDFLPSFSDCLVVKQVCQLIANRAAVLAACGVAATVEKMGRLDKCAIAVDGSLFQHYPNFSNDMKKTLNELYPEGHGITFVPSIDGSGSGAAVISLLSAQ